MKLSISLETLCTVRCSSLTKSSTVFLACPADPAIIAEIEESLVNVDRLMREYEFKGAVDAMMALAAFGNTCIRTNTPRRL